jgi:hypothetical protein
MNSPNKQIQIRKTWNTTKPIRMTVATAAIALLAQLQLSARIWQKKAAKNDMKTTIQAVVRAPNVSVHTLKGFALVLALGAAVQGAAGQLK